MAIPPWKCALVLSANGYGHLRRKMLALASLMPRSQCDVPPSSFTHLRSCTRLDSHTTHYWTPVNLPRAHTFVPTSPNLRTVSPACSQCVQKAQLSPCMAKPFAYPFLDQYRLTLLLNLVSSIRIWKHLIPPLLVMIVTVYMRTPRTSAR